MRPGSRTKRQKPSRKAPVRANTKDTKRSNRLRSYLTHHLQMCVASLGYLSRQPISSLMTSAVIAIALALPAGLYIALDNASRLSAGWDDTTQISLFLKNDTTLKQAEKLATKLRLHKQIKNVSIIDRERGLQEFQQVSGFGDALQFLDENPLPHVITVQPIIEQEDPERVLHLVKNLQQERRVELAQLDMQWVKRLYTLLDIAQRGVWIIGSLLGLAVLLIVGNTIRLDIQNRREVIQVSKLIGASNAFVRRPFLYTGVWYGLFGGLLAWLLIAIALSIMTEPLERLATLYHSNYQISSPMAGDIALMILISCLLGLGGSWLAVGRHLSEIEPS